MMEPYFHAKRLAGGIEVTGASHCVLGHQLSGGSAGKPDGVYASWNWDGKRFHLENDRYGCYPVFYFARNGDLCVSTSIPKLLQLGAPREYDDTAMAVFLRLGYFLGEDTPFRSIRSVPADASFDWEDGVLKVSGRQDVGKLSCSTRSDAVDGYISLFHQAMLRRDARDKEFAVPLSGGRDSRHILLELCRAGHKPNFTVTYRHFPPRNDSDVVCATELSRRLGVPHIVLDQPPSRLKTELNKNLKTSFCSDEHAHYMVLADYLKTRVGVVYDGIGASVLTQSRYLKPGWLRDFRAGEYLKLTRQMLAPSLEEFLRCILTEEAYRRFSLDAAIGRLVDELKKFSDAPNPPGAFHFWDRTRREIALAPYGIYNEIPVVYSPYLDSTLCDFMMGIPADLLFDRGLQYDAIRNEYPEFADIPYEIKGTPVVPLRHFRGYARELLKYVASSGGCRLVRRSYLLARLAYCQLSDNYCAGAISWLLGPLTAYLIHLEEVTSGSSGAA
jgi:hypothetical protein